MNSLTLYFYPSPFGVNWKSPHHLTRSVLFNAALGKSRHIGHVSVELKDQNDKVIFLTGMSSNNFKLNQQLILKDQLGLGVLFYQYPGFLESKEELEKEREKRFHSGRFSFVKFLLSEESYVKVHRYLTEYHEQKKGEWYGLLNRPRYGEGSGCSAFGVSCLDVAGILEDEFTNHWFGSVAVHEELIGNQSKEGKKVSVFKLLIPNKKNSRWAESHEKSKTVSFWDPDMMHSWLLKKWNEKNLYAHYKKIKIQSAKGLEIDFRNRKPTHDPIWL